jgi:phage/plasmid-associated DNA primase
MGHCWISTALFRDFTYSPILDLYGQRASGKGVFADSLLSLFGTPQVSIGLGSV